MKELRVVAAIIRDGDRVLATQRGYGPWKDYWEFPGGKIEPGETPEAALIREIEEELRVRVVPERFFCAAAYDYPDFHLSMDCFLCRIGSGEPEFPEHEAAKWLGREDLLSVGWLPADLAVSQKLLDDGVL
jgi:8-oxo-dGTP diphosphatase